MKDFFQRNMPVFVIGLITIGVFVVIIITAAKNPNSEPILEEIRNEQFITDTTNTVGPKDSKVVLVEFSDFECPACKAFAPTVYSLMDKYKDRVLFAYKHMPLPQHQNSVAAAIASEAAHEQGKFWEYGEKLFDAQPDFSKEKYIELATTLNLDVEKFKQDLDSDILAKRVEDDKQQAIRIRLNATPSFILNNRLIEITSYKDLELQLIAELVRNNISVNTTVETTQSTQASDTAEAKEAEKTKEMLALDNRYGVIEIDYTESGFSPNNFKAIQGQLVRWTNKTERDMKLQQIISLYDELSIPLTIAPGDTFELRLTKDKLWTYKEMDHRHYASIFTVAPEK